MTVSGEKLMAAAGELLPDAVALRRKIHANPELGLDLPETAATVLDSLDGIDLEIARSEKGSGFLATLRGARPGPSILLRADMDALPMPEDTDLEFKSRNEGRMHACGHDAHTAMLSSAARLLDRHRDELSGNVVFMFQPGEEGYFGAKLMIDEGLLEPVPDLGAAFAIHISPFYPPGVVASRPGPIMAAADYFQAQLKGKGGHASMPHDAIDPIPVACEIVQALQTLVTRRVDVFDPVVLTVSQISAGTTANVIPESVRLVGTLRSISEQARERAQEGIRRVTAQVAGAHQVEADIVVVNGYPVTINDAEFSGFARGVATDLLGADAFVDMPAPLMGAEDFSFVLQKLPGAMVVLGVRPTGEGPRAPVHSNRMLLNEDGMQAGIALNAAIALRYLEPSRRQERVSR
jgi:hippurate hydrolase